MRKMMTVRVTKKDIKYGRKGNAESCAIALALKDKGFKCVEVGDDQITVEKKDTVGQYITSGAAMTFIEKFDTDKKTVRPSTFRLKLNRKYAKDEDVW